MVASSEKESAPWPDSNGHIESAAKRLRSGHEVRPEDLGLNAQDPSDIALFGQLMPALRMLAELEDDPLPETDYDSTVERARVTRLRDFTAIREIRRDELGIVYEAYQRSLGHRVLLRVFPEFVTHDPARLQRLTLDVQIIATLKHPNLAPVTRLGIEEDVHYLSAPFLEGNDLQSHISEQLGLATIAWPVSYIVGLMRQAAEGLEHAHRHGIVHRELRIQDLLLTRSGPLKVDGFGLSWLRENANTDPLEAPADLRSVKSPEQLDSSLGVVGPHTDVYRLGLICYHLLTGKPPFHGEDRLALHQAILQGSTIRPRRLAPHLPVDLETIILQAMARDPNDRYRTAKELGEDLERFRNGQPILAQRPRFHQRAVHWIGKKPILGTISLSAIVVVFLVLTILVFASKASLSLAEQKRSVALERERVSRTAVDRLYDVMMQTQPIVALPRGDLPAIMLRSLKAAYQALSKLPIDSLTTQLDQGQALSRLAKLERLLKNPDKAQWAAMQAVELLKPLSDATPKYPARLVLIESLCEAAEAARELSELEAALQRSERAIRLSETATNLREAIANSNAHRIRSQTLVDLERFGEAEDAMRQSVEVAERAALEHLVPENDPFSDYGYRYLHCSSLYNLGKLLSFLGQIDESEPYLRQAASLARGLMAEQPRNGQALRLSADAQEELAITVASPIRRDEAIQIMRQAVADRQAVATQYPNNVLLRCEEAETRLELAKLLDRLNEPSGESIVAFRQVETLFREVIETVPPLAGYAHSRLAIALDAYAESLERQGKTEEAQEVRARANEARSLGTEPIETLRDNLLSSKPHHRAV